METLTISELVTKLQGLQAESYSPHSRTNILDAVIDRGEYIHINLITLEGVAKIEYVKDLASGLRQQVDELDVELGTL